VTKPASEWGVGIIRSRSTPRPARLTSSALGGFPDAEKPCSNAYAPTVHRPAEPGRGVQRSDRRLRRSSCRSVKVRKSWSCLLPCAGHAQGTRLASLPRSCGEELPRRWLARSCLRSASFAGCQPRKPGGAAGRVLEFQGRAIDDEARMTLSDAVRSGVLDASRGRDLTGHDRENMAALLKENGQA